MKFIRHNLAPPLLHMLHPREPGHKEGKPFGHWSMRQGIEGSHGSNNGKGLIAKHASFQLCTK